jgi:hypothetical protein
MAGHLIIMTGKDRLVFGKTGNYKHGILRASTDVL